MTGSAAVDKVQKLLRLAQSSNPHEAAQAAARAQELIDRHHLSQAALEIGATAPTAPDEPIRDFGDGPPLEGGTRERWAMYLASAVATANGARIYLQGGRIQLVGRPSDAETVRYLYAYLYREVSRLSDAAGAGMGRVWRNNFRLGAVETISKRLREQRAATFQAVRDEAPNPAALVLVNAAIASVEKRSESVTAWMKQNMTLRRAGGGSRQTYNGSAREQGRQAGAGISLGGARGLSAGMGRLT